MHTTIVRYTFYNNITNAYDNIKIYDRRPDDKTRINDKTNSVRYMHRSLIFLLNTYTYNQIH